MSNSPDAASVAVQSGQDECDVFSSAAFELGERHLSVERDPSTVAKKLFEGYQCHDERDREGAIAAFTYVDDFQFDHLSTADARAAATALVDSLWAKDDVEGSSVRNGSVDCPDELAQADWSAVDDALRRRARIVGMDETYATQTVRGWKRHKVGGDYAVPLLEAQQLEVKAALRDDAYPEKDRAGQSGFGELPARYLVAVELHDVRSELSRRRIVEVMTPYFETILASRSQQ